MQNDQPSLRFDHREIAVIFSLFIFVSLLMFTVGILVGKGLAQAKYEGTLFNAERMKPTVTPTAAAAAPATSEPAEKITSVSEGETTIAKSEAPAAEETHEPAPPLKLIPEKAAHTDLTGNSLQEPSHDSAAEDLLKNPKIKALLEKEGSAPRATASITPPGKAPASFSQGKFTVQVGSYPTKEDAEQRVGALKKLGFPYAYFSAKELGDKKDTWYRVWLGYFPDLPSAEKSGRMLQERGEVKNYLVRKTDNAG